MDAMPNQWIPDHKIPKFFPIRYDIELKLKKLYLHQRSLIEVLEDDRM
jgi:hypothetical protein